MSYGRSCLVDSNILIRWARLDDPTYPEVELAISTLAQRGVELCYASQNLGEFWNACTRPQDKNGFGMSPEEADSKTRIFESRLRLLPSSLQVHQEWRRLLVKHRISGVQVHDAHLAAVMNVYGIEKILTFNTRDFARFKPIQAISPKEALAAF